MAHPNHSYGIPRGCSVEKGWNLVGSGLEFEFLSWGSWVEDFFFAEFGDECEIGQKSLIEPASQFGQVVSLLILYDPIF